MAYLKFLQSEELLKCTVAPGGSIVTIKFPPGETPVVNTGGFRLYLDAAGKLDIGGDSYIGYTTVYRNDAVTAAYNGYQLSSDGSVYIEPIPTVTFSAGTGGSLEGEKSQKVNGYEELDIPVPVPDKNYIFAGWTPLIPSEGLIESDMNFQAVFSYVPIVTFSAGNGGVIEGVLRQNATDYTDLTIPVPTPDDNYVFECWVPEIPISGKIDGDRYFQAEFSYVPTLEEVREAKVTEMNAVQQAAIAAGVNVTLTDGTVEHFTLTDHDQTSLMGLQSQVMAGEQMIPWHTSDEAEHCKFYSNADMALITAAALAHVTWHVTYFRDLRIYIRSLADKEAVAAVTYGMDIPEEYQSAPLQAMIAAQGE